MTRAEFLREMDAIAELAPGSLTGREALKDLEMWDSTAVISFLALADRNNGVRVAPARIARCATVDDLLELAEVGADGEGRYAAG